jgi:CheY-like chemotaxis protein
MGEPEQTVNGSDSTIAVPAPAVPVPRNKRVLLVDEDPLQRAMLLNKLRMDGFDVEVASNAVVGLEKLPGGDLSGILLDLTNAESNGVELIKAARRDPQFHKRPIFVSTDAMLGSSLARDAHRAGATKIFNRKATTPESMIAEISAMLASPTETSFQTKSETSASEADLVWLRGNYPLLDRCRDHEARADKCRELWSKVHSVAVAATAGRMHYTARAALALEGFLRELCDRPKRYTHTSLRTIGTAIEALAFLSANEVSSLEPPTHEFAALIVDQDLFSRTATSNALRSHGFRLSTFEEPSVAIEHMRAHPINVVLIDLPVAKIDGTDLCKRLCEFALNKNTPVIFVGSEKDLRRSSRTVDQGSRFGGSSVSIEACVEAALPFHIAPGHIQHKLLAAQSDRA